LNNYLIILTKKEAQSVRSELNIDEEDNLVSLFSLLGDKTRFCIVKLLLSRKELCVTDIARITNSSVSATSHQLRLLEMTDMVERERRGQTICYLINEQHPLTKVLKKLV
jgi:ArsR family transcriptional regulator, lead/cadmium/zinc/bismuth-responsive transcriptional repressor